MIQGLRTDLLLGKHTSSAESGHYKDADELTKRLALCCSSIQAGNESLALKNEVEEILTTLLGDGAIGKAEYRAIRSRFVD